MCVELFLFLLEVPSQNGTQFLYYNNILKSDKNIICNLETTWQLLDWSEEEKEVLFDKLEGFEEDSLITFNQFGLKVLPAGKPFIRNICMVFDKYFNKINLMKKMFSNTI